MVASKIGNDVNTCTGIDSICYCTAVNAVLVRITDLEKRGWTLAAIARELGVSYNTVQKWKAGDRKPSNSRLVLEKLEELCRRKRVPRRRPKTGEAEKKEPTRKGS